MHILISALNFQKSYALIVTVILSPTEQAALQLAATHLPQ